MRTLFHGSDSGYSLIDAVVSIFIAGVALVAVYAVLSAAVRFSTNCCKKIVESIQYENDKAEKVLSENAE